MPHMVTNSTTTTTSGGGSDKNSASDDDDVDWWTDHFETCPHSGVGYSPKVTYRASGQPIHEQEMEDSSFCITHEKNGKRIRMYGLFDGFDGGKDISSFAAQRMVAEVLLDELFEEGVVSDHEIKRMLEQAFLNVDTGYFRQIDNLLAKRCDLQMKITGMNSYEATQKHPDTVAELESINQQITGGATAVVVLIVDNRLFVANVGDALAILVKHAATDCDITLWQISKQHDTNDADEQLRLAKIGLDENHIRRFGAPYCTRCIGDYRRKGGYREVERLSSATAEPVIALPSVQGGIPIDESFQFLILSSSGVQTALDEALGSNAQHQLTTVNESLVRQVIVEYNNSRATTRSLNAVAQATLDSIARDHQEAFVQKKLPAGCNKRDDMTLIVCHLHDFANAAGPMITATSTFVDDWQTLQSESTIDDDETAIPDKIPLDENGHILPYVSFDAYYQHPDRARVEAAIAAIIERYRTHDQLTEEDESATPTDD